MEMHWKFAHSDSLDNFYKRSRVQEMCEKRFKKHPKLTHTVLMFSDTSVTSESKVMLWCYEKKCK